MKTKDVLVKNAKGGVKGDGGKPRFDLIDPEWVLGTVKVLSLGAIKYAPDNWKSVERERYIAALYRHWNAYMSGERIDPESGLSHLYHINCCSQFLDWFDRQKDKPVIPSIVREFEKFKPRVSHLNDNGKLIEIIEYEPGKFTLPKYCSSDWLYDNKLGYLIK